MARKENATSGWKILVIDDEQNIRLLYQEEFAQAGYRVETAASAEEALALIEESVPDLITLDIKMNGLDGITFLRRIRERYRHLPVVICTAYGNFKQEFAVWACDAYITKSADVTELVETVRQIEQRYREMRASPSTDNIRG